LLKIVRSQWFLFRKLGDVFLEGTESGSPDNVIEQLDKKKEELFARLKGVSSRLRYKEYEAKALKAALEQMGYQIDIDTLKSREDPAFLWQELNKTLAGRERALDYSGTKTGTTLNLSLPEQTGSIISCGMLTKTKPTYTTRVFGLLRSNR
jgi:hypothetical protein